MGAEGSKQPQISPEQLYEEFKKTVKDTQNGLRKQVSNIEMEEMAIKSEVKKYAQQNQPDIVRVYARGLAQSKREKLKIHQEIAHLQAIETQMRQQVAQNKINAVYSGIASMFATTNEMMNDPAYKAAIRQFAMQNEMMAQKLGMQDEMMEDLFDDDTIETAANEEIDLMMKEILGEKMAGLTIQKPAAQVQVIEDDTVKQAQARLAGM